VKGKGIKIDWDKPLVTVHGNTPYELKKVLEGELRFKFVVGPKNSDACRQIDADGLDAMDNHFLKNEGISIREELKKMKQAPIDRNLAERIFAIEKRLDDLELISVRSKGGIELGEGLRL